MASVYEQIQTMVQELNFYPPNEIFFQVYGKDKAERRIQGHCETLYRFCYPDGEVNYRAEFTSTFRELEVLYKLGFSEMRDGVAQEAKDKFLSAAQAFLAEIEKLSKKDQLLKDHFAPRVVKYQVLKSLVHDL